MKANVTIFIGCLIITFLYSAEKPITKVQLFQMRSFRCIDGKADAIIVGKNAQFRQLGYHLNDTLTGKLSDCSSNIIYVKKQRPIQYPIHLSKVVYVTEPYLRKEAYRYEKDTYCNQYIYETMRTKERCPKLLASFEFYGNDALEETKKDLALCYREALSHFAENNVRNIAFLPIGLESDLPWKDVVRIAVNSVYDYRNKSPYHYECIWLCIMRMPGDYRYRKLYKYYKQLLNHYQK